MVERVGQDQAARHQLADGRNSGLVRHVAGGEQERRVLAVEVGQLALKLDQRMIGAGDVTGAACPGTHAGCSFDHGADHLRVLSHAEVVVGTPDHDAARAGRRVPDGMGIASGDALKVGKDAVTPFVP